jgi:hypothetical protein
MSPSAEPVPALEPSGLIEIVAPQWFWVTDAS